ncbi:hypothetical protein [Arenibacterium sp. LLYu02]|uniref:hypothetical protein n=1 Tax=Arenibacterium sp. LLYu02 TaxID=3404132 RepID=UPI003B20C7E3
MIAVIIRYYPHKSSFDLVLNAQIEVAEDKRGRRIGCYETRLFSSRETCEIKSVSLWESQEAFETFVDLVIENDGLFEFQAEHLRHEITTQIYDTVISSTKEDAFAEAATLKRGA